LIWGCHLFRLSSRSRFCVLRKASAAPSHAPLTQASEARSCGARHPCRFITRLPASALLSLAWPRESRQREGHPTLAPYAQSLCSRCARPLRGSLAHIVWAILRTFPAQPRRDRGDPDSAHRARQSQSPSATAPCVALPPASVQSSSAFGTFSRLAGEGQAKAKAYARVRGNSLRPGCARCAVDGPPMQRQRDGGIAHRVAQGIAPSSTPVQGWTVGEPPESRCVVGGQEARRPLYRGGLSLYVGLLPSAPRAGCAIRAAPAAQWPRKEK
jgi:hypothetical protein